MILTEEYYAKRSEALAIPGALWDRDLRAWTVDETKLDDDSRRVLFRLFPAAAASAGLPTPTVPDIRPVDYATEWAGDRSASQLLPQTSESLTSVLRDYQKRDLGYIAARLRQDGAAYIGWDRGLGKTLAAITLVDELRPVSVAIVCPNSSKDLVWAAEFDKWLPEYPHHNFGGTKKRREQALSDWRERGGALLVHYEGLRLHDWTSERIDMLVIDEAHRLARGSRSTKSPEFYKRLRKIKTPYRLMLSGSITVNSPEDLFGALHLMYPERYSSKWRDWNNRYMHYVESSTQGNILVGVKPEKAQAMREELAGFLVQRLKEDELPDLPERVDQLMRVPLSPGQRKVYDDLAAKFMAALPDGDIVMAPNVVSQLVKLRQIATGLDLMGEHLLDSTKIDTTMELIEDNLPHKTVVFCWHRATVEAISARLLTRKIEHGKIHGGITMKNRTAAVELFQSDSNNKVMVATLKTLGEAVQLHAATDVIFVEQSWVPSDMEQAADRVHRHGQENRVTVTTLVARDTIDEMSIMPTVTDKLNLRKLVLGR